MWTNLPFFALSKLFSNGLFVTRNYVDEKSLSRFLERLYPVKTGHDLIRLGSEGDGGYLLPDDLEGVTTCFSPGVSENSSFELDLYERFNIESYLCDNSVSWPSVDCDGFNFIKKHLNSFTDSNAMTLESWVATYMPESGDSILQMDIESAEYNVIIHTDKSIFDRFRILIIEFHNFHYLFNKIGHRTLVSCFDKLLDNFRVVHIHPNNNGGVRTYGNFVIPSEMEFTFLRKDRISDYSYANEFPHPLDADNVSTKKGVALPEMFYKN